MKKILVADDNVQVAKSIKKLLSPLYEVDTVNSTVETLVLCKTKSYDGLIIDIDFGNEVNGLEAVSLIRQENSKIKVIVFSAIDYSDEVLQSVSELGAVFFVKPLKLDQILSFMEDSKNNELSI